MRTPLASTSLIALATISASCTNQPDIHENGGVARDHNDSARADAIESELRAAKSEASWTAVWDPAEAFAREVLQNLDPIHEHEERLRPLALSILGEALLRQGLVAEASALLNTATEEYPDHYPLKRVHNLTLGGYFEVDRSGTLREVIAGGEPALAYDRHWGQYQTWALHPEQSKKGDLLWYETHLESFMFALLAARDESGNIIDARHLERARLHARIIRSHAALNPLRNRHSREGSEMARLFDALLR
ncbi:MAG: hypothetical protein AAF196_17915 [Planctomycetota bacterium]